MYHEIKINLKELISLKSAQEQFNLVTTIIVNEFSDRIRKRLIVSLLDDDLQYLKDDDFDHSDQEKELIKPIEKIIDIYTS